MAPAFFLRPATTFVNIKTVGVIVRRFGAGGPLYFEGYEIATSAFSLLATTASIKSSLTGYYGNPRHYCEQSIQRLLKKTAWFKSAGFRVTLSAAA